jgi:hypothetical protein
VDVIETGTGDLARRGTHRRQELGLTREEVARRRAWPAADELGIEPWPGGRARAVIGVEPASIFGRPIRQQDSLASAPPGE